MIQSLSILLALGWLLLCSPTPAYAQAKSFGFIHHRLTDKQLGTVEYHISDSLHTLNKPLILFLDGSGDNPLFYYKKHQGAWALFSGLAIPYKQWSAQYHVVCISKPGVAFLDTLHHDDGQHHNAAYHQKLSLQWRVKAVQKVLDDVLKRYAVDASKIAVWGYSEGAQVAPHAALNDKRITHCIAMVGSGLNQLFNPIIDLRFAAQAGEISHEEAQRQIDSLLEQYAHIYQYPQSDSLFWYGHTYKRWASFCSTPVVESMLQLSIPVYVAQASADRNTSVLSSDYIRLEAIRLGKTNIHYKVYPGCNHFFMKQNGEQTEMLMDSVMDEAYRWLGK